MSFDEAGKNEAAAGLGDAFEFTCQGIDDPGAYVCQHEIASLRANRVGASQEKAVGKRRISGAGTVRVNVTCKYADGAEESRGMRQDARSRADVENSLMERQVPLESFNDKLSALVATAAERQCGVELDTSSMVWGGSGKGGGSDPEAAAKQECIAVHLVCGDWDLGQLDSALQCSGREVFEDGSEVSRVIEERSDSFGLVDDAEGAAIPQFS